MRKSDTPKIVTRDPQRMRVYRWGWKFTEWDSLERLTVRQLRRLAVWMCKKVNVEEPPHIEILANSNGKRSWYDPSDRTIYLLPEHTILPQLLHEMAHFACDNMYGQTVQGHGKEWLGIYLLLLEMARSMPPKAFVDSATREGLEFTFRNIPRSVLKRAGLYDMRTQ